MSDAKTYREVSRKDKAKRYALYVLFILILVASNVGTIYAYRLYDRALDAEIGLTKCESKLDGIIEKSIQCDVALQEATEPDEKTSGPYQ